MKEKDLKHRLQQSFNFAIWKEILPLFFKKMDYFSHPENLFTENDKVIAGKQIGTVKLDDSKQLAIFTVEVADNISIIRNRQGLREIAAKHIDQNIIHGALAFFYNKKQADYRFSFIAKEASIDLETGELIKGETKPKRFTYLLGANEACTTAAKRMLVLAGKKEKGEVNIKELKEVFSVEALNKDFFKTYKAHYEKFSNHLSDDENPFRAKLIDTDKETKDKQEKPIRDFVKKMLGRIVFLQFLEKKGWMGVPVQLPTTNEPITNSDWINGDTKFLYHLFENCPDKVHFHSKFLTTLFFKTLNTKREGDLAPKGLVHDAKHAIGNCKIPYLNGGLFEPEKNKATLEIDFPVEFFKELLDFFDQYNFTIDENSPDDHEVGIDPEMLGHIFENLLEDNRDKGAFYTPKEIVQYMCKESLIQYLLNAFKEQKDIEAFIRLHTVSPFLAEKENAILLNQQLDDIKVCDPAIGSGAFPIGILQEIFEAKRFIYPYLKTNQDFKPAEVKKNIIQNSIYGVDLEKGAVDIAQLRFWLLLVVDELNSHPLPNLDYKIMQGNSLMEEFGGFKLEKLMDEEDSIIATHKEQLTLGAEFEAPVFQLEFFDRITKEQLWQLLEKHYDPVVWETRTGEMVDKTQTKKNINYIIEGKIHAFVLKEQRKLRNEIAQKKKDWNIFNEDYSKLNQKSKDYKKFLENSSKLEKLNNLENQLIKLHESEEKPFFLWHTWFKKEVFEKGGFDVIIGNPPYINVENLDLITKKHLFENFTTCKGRTDIYVAFIEFTLKLLKKHGTLSYIIPYPYTNQIYGTESRKLLIEQYHIKEIVDTSEYNVFDTAIVKNIILSIVNEINNNDTEIKKASSQENFIKNKFECTQINQRKFLELKDYRFETKDVLEDFELKPKIWNNCVRLEDICLIAYGARLNHKTEKINKSNYVHNNYSKNFKPFIEGKNIERYYYIQKGWLDYRPNEHYNSMFPELFENDKLVFINVVSNKLRFALDKEKMFNSHTVINCVKWDLLINAQHPTVKKNISAINIEIAKGFYYGYLLVILNSKLTNWYFKSFLSESLHFYPNDAKSLPIAKISIIQQKPFETLSEYLIYLNDPKQEPVLEKTSNETVSQVFEELVNMMVYELYFEEEMKTKEIDVLQFITSTAFPDITKAADKKALIQKVYYELQQNDNPIRNRILVAGSKSETIARINAATS